MKRLALVFAAVGTLIAISCSQSNAKEEAETVSVADKKSNKAALHKVSELAGLMRDMNEQFKEIRGFVERGEAIPDSLKIDFSTMHSAEATNPNEIGQTFNGMADAFLYELQQAYESGNPEAFNAAVKACVNCHEQHCPGPIKRIQKLTIPI